MPKYGIESKTADVARKLPRNRRIITLVSTSPIKAFVQERSVWLLLRRQTDRKARPSTSCFGMSERLVSNFRTPFDHLRWCSYRHPAS